MPKKDPKNSLSARGPQPKQEHVISVPLPPFETTAGGPSGPPPNLRVTISLEWDWGGWSKWWYGPCPDYFTDIKNADKHPWPDADSIHEASKLLGKASELIDLCDAFTTRRCPDDENV